MSTLLNMPQQLCSQCREKHAGLLLPDSGMSKEASMCFLWLYVTFTTRELQQGHHLFKAEPASWGIMPLRHKMPSELCFAMFRLTDCLLHFLSHTGLLVALLGLFLSLQK